MTSTIRPVTEEEKGLVKTFAECFQEGPIKGLVKKAEQEYGFRVIFKKHHSEELPILMSSGRVLVWDFNPQSLDTLSSFESDKELQDAARYAGIIAYDYLTLQSKSS